MIAQAIGPAPAVSTKLRRMSAQGLGWVGLLMLCVSLAQAAPTSGSETDSNSTNNSSSNAPAAAGGGQPAKAGNAAVSTGNKNLDLLLEMQGHVNSEKGGLTAPRAGASAPTAAAVGINRPTGNGNSANAGMALPSMGGDSGFGGGQQGATQPGNKREWSGAGGATSSNSSNSSGGGQAESATDSGGPSRQSSGSDGAVTVPRAVIQFMREYRLWIAGAVLILLGVGAGLTSYSRRS